MRALFVCFCIQSPLPKHASPVPRSFESFSVLERAALAEDDYTRIMEAIRR